MRVLVVPDSFKGSLSAASVCSIIADAFPDDDVRLLPVADGGEGSIHTLVMAVGGERKLDEVAGPFGDEVEAERGLLPDGTAVVELAQAAGLPLVGEDRRVQDTTTFGVGEQLRRAADEGATDIIVAIGGSATNDGGCGAAAACGVEFLDERGEPFVPTGGTLRRIASIDASGFDDALADADIVAMCDVDNPLTGPHGAAAVFGPQKGADRDTVLELDEGLRHLAEVIRRDLDVDVEDLPGAGAAGGMGAGLVAFFGARLERGIDVVLDTIGFDELVARADVVITGEGSFDTQSLRGKVIDGVAARARRAGVPVHVLAGRVSDDVLDEARDLGILSATSITPPGVPTHVAISRAPEFLAAAAERLAERLHSDP